MFKELIPHLDPFLMLILGGGAVFLVVIIAVLWLRSRPKAEHTTAEKAQPPAVGAPQPRQHRPSADIEAVKAMPPPSMEAEAPPVGSEQEDHYVVTVHYGTDREDLGATEPAKDRYSDNRARAPRGTSPVTYGTCDVSIPKVHKIGELEAPGWFESEQPGRHVMLLSLKTRDRDEFLQNLDAAMADEKQAFVFVHGFSVSFEAVSYTHLTLPTTSRV